MGAIARLSNTTSGLSPAAVRQLYQACVIPIADFGAEVWWKGQKGFCAKMDIVQNTALRKIMGAFRTTPIGALQTEAAMPPTHFRLDHLRRKYALRVINMPKQHPIRARCPNTFPPHYHTDVDENNKKFSEWDDPPTTTKPHRTRLISILSTLRDWIDRTSEVETYSTTSIPPWTESLAKTIISSKSKTNEAEHHNEVVHKIRNNRRALISYTDGSKLDNKIGAGLVIEMPGQPDIERTIPMGTRAEVYDAELEGIQAAAQKILQVCQIGSHTINEAWIFTDNQAAVQRISTLKPAPGQAAAITVAKVSKLLQEHNITLTIQWVPGHTDVEGNEKADQLAKAATQESTSQHSTSTLSYLKRICREKMIEEWEKDWRSKKLERGRRYGGPFKRKPDVIFETNNRQLVSAVTQLRTGHGYFKPYLYKRNTPGITTPNCPCDRGTFQTPQHLLLTCSRYHKAREEMKKRARFPKLNLSTLLYTTFGLNSLKPFLTETRIGTREGIQRRVMTPNPDPEQTEGPSAFGHLGDHEEEHGDEESEEGNTSGDEG